MDTTRPGGPDDIKATLRAIQNDLEYHQVGVGSLIAEVRDSMRGSAGNTVKDSIVELQTNIIRELKAIQDGLRGGGGFPAAPNQAGGLAGPSSKLEAILEDIDKHLQELEHETGIIGEARRSGGGKGSSQNAFSLEASMGRYNATENVLKLMQDRTQTSTEKLSGTISILGDLIGGQYVAQQKTAIRNMLDLSVRSTDLISIFEKLGAFIKTQIIERYSGLFMKDRSLGLTGNQTFFDDLERIFSRGINHLGYSYNDTTEAVKRNSEGGGSPSTLIYGQNIAQLSLKFSELAETMKKAGHDPMSTFSPQQFMQFAQDQASFMKSSRIFDKIGPDQQVALMTRSMVYFSDIAKFTGVSAEKLTEMAKKTDAETIKLQALGLMNPQQANAYRLNSAALESMGPGGKELNQLVLELIKNDQNVAQMMGNNTNFAQANALTQGRLGDAIAAIAKNITVEQSGRSFLAATVNSAKQVGGLAGGSGIAQLGIKNPEMGAWIGAAQSIGGLSSEKINKYQIPAETDPVKGAAERINELSAKLPQLIGLFGGLIGAATSLTASFITLLAASRLLSAGSALRGFAGGLGGGGGGGAGAAGGSMLAGAGRALGPIVGGAVGAGQAYMEGSSGAGVAGAGIGGFGGAGLGMFVGSFAGPIGTAVGGVVGSYLGSVLGRMGGEAISPPQAAPAVPPPTNVYGADAAQAAAATSSSYQDSSLALLTQIAAVGAQGNAILGQMYELARRGAGAVAGSMESATTGGTPAFAATPISESASRPGASYPWISAL